MTLELYLLDEPLMRLGIYLHSNTAMNKGVAGVACVAAVFVLAYLIHFINKEASDRFLKKVLR